MCIAECIEKLFQRLQCINLSNDLDNNAPKNKQKIIYIAYSGGIDSSVLLHAVYKYLQHNTYLQKVYYIKAIHINHGISDNANTWTKHCIAYTKQFNIECIIHNIDKNTFQVLQKSMGTEGAARKLRYESIQNIAQNNIVLLGQHAQDQIETFLLQWKRGSGIDGLCAMPYSYTNNTDNNYNYNDDDNINHITYYRPLLHINKIHIQTYAKKYALKWVEDESNQDITYKRNHIRKEVIPKFSAEEQKNMLRSIHILQIQKNALDNHLQQQLSSLQLTTYIEIYQQSTLLNIYYNDTINVIPNNFKIFKAITETVLLNYSLFKNIYTQDYNLAVLIFRYWLRQNALNIEGYDKTHDVMRQLFEHKNTSTYINGITSININIPYQNVYIIAYNNILCIVNKAHIFFLKNNNDNNVSNIFYTISNKHHITIKQIPTQQTLQVKINKRPTKTLKHVFQEQKVAPFLRGLPSICNEYGYVLYHPLLNL